MDQHELGFDEMSRGDFYYLPDLHENSWTK